MEKICKIVYFDEESVTDYVQIVAGGELEETTELLKSRDAKEGQEAQVSGKVGISGLFKALLGWEAEGSAKVYAGLEFNSSKMVKNIVKNTILTDFLNTIDESRSGKSSTRLPKGTIKQFKGYKISAEKDSLSYMVMVSPYLSMLESDSSIPAGEFSIAIDKLDNALRHAKGYYEFVGTKGRSRVILRFNINAFRNSYTISDLLKMDLSIGCCIEYEDLSIEQKQAIIENWYETLISTLQEDEQAVIYSTNILKWFKENADRYDNIRILKTKLENAIFEKLSDEFIINK